MKTRSFILSLSCALVAMASCQQKEMDFVVTKITQELEFSASLGDAQETRTHLQVDGQGLKVQWDSEEHISVFYGGANSTGGFEFSSYDNTNPEEISFTGTIDAFTGVGESNQALSFWAVYPFSSQNAFDGNDAVTVTLPSVQTAVEENVLGNVMPMVAKSSGLTLGFFNIGTLLRVCVSTPGITGIVFRGNNGEVVSGRVSVTMGSDGKPVWSRINGQGKTYVTLKAPEGETFEVGKYYYIAFLPQTFSNGWSLSFQKAGDAGNPGSFGFYKKTDSAVFERAKGKNASNRDDGVTFSSFIDMGGGLNGLKFAEVNIGGSSPEDAGDLFAWGETTTKSEYNSDNYFWSVNGAYTKYTTADGKTVLDPEDDPATIICGEDWRTPTKEEWNVLKQITSTAIGSPPTTVDFTSLNGRTLTLYAGRSGTAYYWSSTLNPESTVSSFSITRKSTDPGYSLSTTATRNRYLGSYIRPIYARVFVQSVSLSQNTLELYEGQSATLTAIINPENATKKNVIWESDNPNVATVDENGTVTAIAEGETTIFVSTVDGDCTAECTVTVTPLMVQMGNGYWAISNIGAESPEDPGSPYAWGEIETKATYSWENYKWMMNGQTEGRYITKYQYLDGNTDAIWYNKNGGFIGDGWSILRSEDDVANQKLGDNWHIPSETQWLWLRDNCEWVYDTEKSGFWVISQASGFEGNKIFLPFSRSVEYWSSTIYGYNSTYAQGLSFNSPLSLSQFAISRCQSFYIRPIYSDKKQVGQVTLNKTALTLKNIGDTEALTAGVLPSDALEAGVVWSSTDPSIATVDRLGTVTAVSNGVTTIRARSVADYTKTATCTVTVIAHPVTGVTLNQTSATMEPGNSLGTLQLTATVQPSNATNKAVTWTTSNASVATVTEGGLVRAVSPGSAIITVTTVEGGFTATCSVTVNVATSGTHNGYYWVDMGNGMKWALENVGGASYLSPGRYFMWGDPTLRDNFVETDYNPNSNTDVATAKWGQGWRTPTKAELEWLIANCTWEYRDLDGLHHGFIVTSRITNKSFTLVEAGYKSGTNTITSGFGDYWSSTLTTSGGAAWFLRVKGYENLNNGPAMFTTANKYEGRLIHPILDLSE